MMVLTVVMGDGCGDAGDDVEGGGDRAGGEGVRGAGDREGDVSSEDGVGGDAGDGGRKGDESSPSLSLSSLSSNVPAGGRMHFPPATSSTGLRSTRITSRTATAIDPAAIPMCTRSMACPSPDATNRVPALATASAMVMPGLISQSTGTAHTSPVTWRLMRRTRSCRMVV